MEATTAGGEDKEKDKKQNLVVEEETLHGNIGLRDYMNLFSFSIGNAAIIIYIILAVVTSLVQLIPSYVITKWTAMDLEGQQERSDLMWLFVGSTLGYMVFVFIRSTSC
jgi:hypothetical protein